MAGNMYEGKITLNPMGGRCEIECIYCSSHTLRRTYPNCKIKYNGEYRLYPGELKRNYEGKEIFMFAQMDFLAQGVPRDIIQAGISYAWAHLFNTYLWQTKNPGRFQEFIDDFPPDSWLGTTIETDREAGLSNAAPPHDRARAMSQISGYKKYITHEPIGDFNLNALLYLDALAEPDKIYIGADSKGHHLQEPNKEKLQALIGSLEASGYWVELKSNIGRLL